MQSVSIPRAEYPRPDFVRTEWLNLNGEWDFEFDDGNTGENERWYNGREFSGKITVPFCYQCKSSGINNTGMHENLWYRRSFDLPSGFRGKRVLLNFGAVDYIAKVWINGEFAGSHSGGYTPFKIDISRYLKDAGNEVVVKSEDRYDCTQPRGKQYWKEKPDRCWYTATSGIWQTVWLEAVGDIFIDKVRLTPDIDRKNVLAEIFLDKEPYTASAQIEVSYKGSTIKMINVSLTGRISRVTIDINEEDYIDEIHYWTPENPNLYDVRITISKDDLIIDSICSYFGMRKIAVEGDEILLNNKPYYQKLVLDQGYWPESLLTPPSDEAIVYDIEMTKKLGFNGARKHQKIEDPRYYYWADKLGLLVWGEMPSGYWFNSDEIKNITSEWIEFINRDYNHPCIIAWTPLNESWGVRNIYSNKEQQNFARTLYHLTKAMDPIRYVSTNDGWEQVESDICAIHDYIAWGEDFTPKYQDKDKLLSVGAVSRMLYAQGSEYEGQPILLTEYGGIAFESEDKDNWGYNGAVRDEEGFLKRYSSITSAVKDMKYIRGYCYTQLTDVMQEVNGLLTADRKPKVSVEAVRKINS
jgi:beta-galactosidase/beta-glucuronidase